MTSVKLFLEEFTYDPETGAINDTSGRVRFNTAALSGYRVGGFKGKTYYAHRVAWLLHYGSWPCGEVDHIDRSKDNNAICNLRIASKSQNNCNKIAATRNTSGMKGVSKHSRRNLWMARISLNGTRNLIGYYKTPEEASEAYKAEADRIHGEFACY